MGPNQFVEVTQSLQNHRKDQILSNPAISALNEFIAESTQRLIDQHITVDEHNVEIARLAVQQREIDPFTGMFNKEGFKTELRAAIAVAKELELALTLILVDGDGFGKINKDPNLGYLVGDRVVQAVAFAIQEATKRASDVKAHIESEQLSVTREARPGGDEFAIILLATDLEGAQVVGNRIREEVITIVDEAVPEYRQRYNKPLTVSLGLAQFDPDTDNPESLIEKADLSLRTEKRLKKFGDIPLPDLSDLVGMEMWIRKWVNVPLAPAENDPKNYDPVRWLSQEHHTLMDLARYAKKKPEIWDSVVDILVKAATRKVPQQ